MTNSLDEGLVQEINHAVKLFREYKQPSHVCSRFGSLKLSISGSGAALVLSVVSIHGHDMTEVVQDLEVGINPSVVTKGVIVYVVEA